MKKSEIKVPHGVYEPNVHIYKKKNEQSLHGLLGKYLLNTCFAPSPSHLQWLTTWQTIEMFDLKMILFQLKANISIHNRFPEPKTVSRH